MCGSGAGTRWIEKINIFYFWLKFKVNWTGLTLAYLSDLHMYVDYVCRIKFLNV